MGVTNHRVVRGHIYGVDLAKVFAIFLVLLVHALGHMSGFVNVSPQGRIAWTFSICCVDLFALISGYVGVCANFRWSRIAMLWVQAVFIGACVVSVGMMANVFQPNVANWKQVFFPITSRSYWYLTEYFLLFLFMPFLNAGFAILSKRQVMTITVLMFLLVFVLPRCIVTKQSNYFLGYGYSAIWLMICYMFGGAIRMLDIGYGKFYFWALIAVILNIFSYSHCVGIYSHPLPFLTAIAYMMACLRVRINSDLVRRTVKVLATCSFGVYLWHVQPMIWEKSRGVLSFVCGHNPYVALLEILGICIFVFCLLAAIEFLRIKLFSVCRIVKILQMLLDRSPEIAWAHKS